MYILQEQKQRELFTDAATAAVRAGAKIMSLFNSDDYEITMKSDNSPFSLADKVAHDEIKNYLAKSRIPIISEEGRDMSYDERKASNIYWLVDPLDGTRQFIQKRKEFTVNIALIIDNYPEFSVIYAPAYKQLYFGHRSFGACKIENITANENIKFEYRELLKNAVKMPSVTNNKVFTILASPNHTTQSTLDYIEEMRKKHGEVNVISMGSSLKMCLLADGQADVYARHADTYEWDTAAAQAILEASGCSIKSWDTCERLTYNKESLINPWFICERNA